MNNQFVTGLLVAILIVSLLILFEAKSELATFTNQLGTFTIPTESGPYGAGYITTWIRPDGKEMTKASPGTTQAAGAYANDPGDRPVGIGALSMYCCGKPPLRYWDTSWGDSPPDFAATIGNRRTDRYGITKAHPASVTGEGARQRLELAGGGIVLDAWWRFPQDEVKFDAKVTFHPLSFFVKEPEFAFGINGSGSRVKSIATPGTPCPTYDGLTDPRRRTGRCEHPGRRTVLLGGRTPVRVRIWDLNWRSLCADAKNWPRAGDETLPWRKGEQLHTNWEYVAVAKTEKKDKPSLRYQSLVCLFKAWEGGVTGLDFSYAYRRPQGSHTYRFGMSFRKPG